MIVSPVSHASPPAPRVGRSPCPSFAERARSGRRPVPRHDVRSLAGLVDDLGRGEAAEPEGEPDTHVQRRAASLDHHRCAVRRRTAGRQRQPPPGARRGAGLRRTHRRRSERPRHSSPYERASLIVASSQAVPPGGEVFGRGERVGRCGPSRLGRARCTVTSQRLSAAPLEGSGKGHGPAASTLSGGWSSCRPVSDVRSRRASWRATATAMPITTASRAVRASRPIQPAPRTPP
jgi:hypothetical protein